MTASTQNEFARDALEGGSTAKARGGSAIGDYGLMPPLSPAGLAGVLLRPVPPALMRPLADAAARMVLRSHPEVRDRLVLLGEAAILIDPIDLPIAFVVRPGARAPLVEVVRGNGPSTGAAATVRGPLALLVDLLEGRLDGDALFFSRELAIEGDTEVVVALRNAVESAEIDLARDLLAALGPFAAPAGRIHHAAVAALARAARDLGALRAAVTRPLADRVESLAARVGELEAELAALRRTRRPRRRDRAA